MASQFSEVTRRYVPGKGEYVFFKDGRQIAREWKDELGIENVEGDIPDGIVRTYYEDSNGNETNAVFAEWSYKNGRLEGISRVYGENGLLEEELHYSDGKIDRILKKYYENGKLSFESTISNIDGHATFEEYEAKPGFLQPSLK